MKTSCCVRAALPVRAFLCSWLILTGLLFGFSRLELPGKQDGKPSADSSSGFQNTGEIEAVPDPAADSGPSQQILPEKPLSSVPDAADLSGNPDASAPQLMPVYYNQKDSSWSSLAYGEDDIGNYGCGPTCCAMIISTLTEYTVTPADMADWSVKNGCYIRGGGSYHVLIPAACRSYGLQVTGCTAADKEKILSALKKGALCGVLMGKGHFTRTGHFILLYGVDPDGRLLVADPASRENSVSWNADLIFKEAKPYAGGGGPFWIIEKTQ